MQARGGGGVPGGCGQGRRGQPRAGAGAPGAPLVRRDRVRQRRGWQVDRGERLGWTTASRAAGRPGGGAGSQSTALGARRAGRPVPGSATGQHERPRALGEVATRRWSSVSALPERGRPRSRSAPGPSHPAPTPGRTGAPHQGIGAGLRVGLVDQGQSRSSRGRPASGRPERARRLCISPSCSARSSAVLSSSGSGRSRPPRAADPAEPSLFIFFGTAAPW